MKKYIFLILPALIAANQVKSQDSYPRSDREVYRTEFVSYDVRADADKRNRDASAYYMPLEFQVFSPSDGSWYLSEFDIPFKWLDRDLFLQIESGFPAVISINDNEIAFISDDRTPTQLNINDLLRDGQNRITLRHINPKETVLNGGSGVYLTEGISGNLPEPGSTAAGVRPPHAKIPHVFIFSQPKLRIEDYTMKALPDSAWKYGILELEIVVANSYNFPEKITVGYDIYAPQGKLQYYDMAEVTIPGQGRDTVRFREFIYGTPGNWWDTDNPALYYGMLTIRRGSMMTEYIPYRIGFGTTEIIDGRLFRNAKAVTVVSKEYNVSETAYSREAAEKFRKDIQEFKKIGINTLILDYPQPYWFYDICDELGMYVFDQANINSDSKGANRNIDGAATNDPSLLDESIDRTRTMYERNKNRTSIIGWSLGGQSGNGYNMYKTYQWLKEREVSRAVYFRDAAGEWNTDIDNL